ncbi:MAG TPA: RidA family protein [Steroidobacteraceae bacterium]|nr:RidA family protein [Steroidobacteraceae bacterium]
MSHKVLQPEGWARPRGYSNGIAARGTQVFIAGQVGWNAEQRFVHTRLAPQVAAALANVLRVLAEAGGRPEHIVRLTWYLTSRREYLDELPEIGAAYRAVMGRHFPAMSVVEVSALIEAEAKVEIEATAVLPDA